VRCKGAAGEAGPDTLGLPPAFGRERRIHLALDAALAIPGRLAVPDEDKARRLWTR